MKPRRICTRVDDLNAGQKKELRTRINKTVEDYNEELTNPKSNEETE